MIGLFRRFATFRDLESRLDKAQVEILYWRSRAETFETMAEKRETEKTHYLKMVADWEAIQLGMRPIFGVAPIPPEKPEPEPQTRRRQARDVVRDAELEFEREYAEMLNRQS